MAWLVMEHCQATNLFAICLIKSQDFSYFVEMSGLKLKVASEVSNLRLPIPRGGWGYSDKIFASFLLHRILYFA